MNLSSEPPAFSRAERFDLRRINLNNYYKYDTSGLTTHCQICKINVAKADIFEHTISKRHKYNKLFVGIAQGEYPNEDLDFIILNRDQLQCRYCDSLTINSARDNIIGHIEWFEHRVRKQNYLDKTNTPSTRDSTIDRKSLKALDNLITVKQKNKFNVTQFSGSCGASELPDDNELPSCIVVTEDNNMYKCTVCTKIIPYSSFNMKQHINGKAHKEMVKKSTSAKSVIQLQKIVTPRESPKPVVTRQNSTYTCSTCRTEMIYTASVIAMHNLSRIHVINERARQASLRSIDQQRANSTYEIPSISDKRSTTSYPRSSVNYARSTTSYHTPVTSDERSTTSYPRSSINYTRSTTSYHTPVTTSDERSFTSYPRSSVNYSRSTASYYTPVTMNYDRPKEESLCNIL